MRKLLGLLVACLLWSYGCGPTHEEATSTPPVYTDGAASLANVDFDFTFGGNNGLDIINNNAVDIKVRVINVSTRDWMINELVVLPGDVASYNSLNIELGDKVEVQLWLGTASVWYANYHSNEPDLIAQGTLQNGWIDLSIINSIIGYDVVLEMINGAVCEFSGRLSPTNPGDQMNSTFYCENAGAEVLHVEVYHLELHDGGGYEATSLITDLWIANYGGFNIAQLNYDFEANEPVAIRVSAHDSSFNWIVREETLGLYLNAEAQSYAKIIGPIYLP